MNKENYPTWLVPINIAKGLREIGFKEPTMFYFISGESDIQLSIYDDISLNYNLYINDIELINYNTKGFYVSIPTWEQALAWFREKDYYGNLEATSKFTSVYIFYPELDNGEFWEFDGKETYEEAREALLLKLIDLYKAANQ
nr:hypothetical protein [uncultured Capnocytophaga sp.]